VEVTADNDREGSCMFPHSSSLITQEGTDPINIVLHVSRDRMLWRKVGTSAALNTMYHNQTLEHVLTRSRHVILK
jgi:hypothetical protein